MKPNPSTRLKLAVRGAVQGVGFRPFVHRLATEHRLAGWVNNSPQGVFIEAEGSRAELEKFLQRLEKEKPPRSSIQSVETSWLAAAGYVHFEIRESETDGDKTTLVLPDIATCPDCLREIFDPQNRRHLYPFTNCTNCGPRFSIIKSLPYDRANTTMKKFAMCPDCEREYRDPRNRRFHAQPNACPVCGPHLELWECNANFSGKQNFLARDHTALLVAARAIHRGQIVAVKGIGGFHLMVDARNEKAVQRLRLRKHREEKPFALLFPSLESIKAVCEMSAPEEKLLLAPEAPIVLLRKRNDGALEGWDEDCGCAAQQSINPSIPQSIAFSVAPGNPNLGIMLPSNPLHHLLMAELKFPVVATSGNLSDEPICIDEREALERLGNIADLFLVYNRPIVRQMDDSIARVIDGRPQILRRARGYAPLPVQVRSAKRGTRSGKPDIILAVGAHLKNSIALAIGENVFISQHIGDLETEPANAAFRKIISDFEKLYDVKPEIVAADLHPDYLSTRFASESGQKVIGVQHHIAHALSCIAENEIELPALGVAWDGTGFGTDGEVWGGEFFLVAEEKIQRAVHLRPFRLPGGSKAVKQPRRVALALLYELYGEAAFEMNHLAPLRQTPPIEMMTLKRMLQRNFNSPSASSIGRLFDAVASLINLRQLVQFEGQAAMDLEFAMNGFTTAKHYDLPIIARHGATILDWSEMIHAILVDLNSGVSLAEISAKFHNALAEAIVAVAKILNQKRVALSGGCFQNRYLLERAITRLREEKLQPFWHQRVPPNDGGIAFGQIMAARREIETVRRAAHAEN